MEEDVCLCVKVSSVPFISDWGHMLRQELMLQDLVTVLLWLSGFQHGFTVKTCDILQSVLLNNNTVSTSNSSCNTVKSFLR